MDPYLALLDHRNTPSQGLNTSPAQRLLSRRTRTLLPTKDTLLKPKVSNNKQGLIANSQRLEYYNRTAKDLDYLTSGDSVRVQPFEPCKTWKTARVIRPVSPRSYEVELESGSVLRRNRRHLRRNYCPPSTSAQTGVLTNTQTVAAECGQGSDQSTVTTRSGRQVKMPTYLRDYTV